MFKGVFEESIIKIARDKGLVDIKIHNLREWTIDKHKKVDDKPFGGGRGMVIKVEPVDRALKDIKKGFSDKAKSITVLLTPRGDRVIQKRIKELAVMNHIILICGHYEGFDERITNLVDMELSIGDYVLSCGEIPAMAVCDSVIRLIPGVLGSSDSLNEESFNDNNLEYPQYTRPADYKGMKVPEILLCGDHKKIAEWKKEQSIKRTRARRPDLL